MHNNALDCKIKVACNFLLNPTVSFEWHLLQQLTAGNSAISFKHTEYVQFVKDSRWFCGHENLYVRQCDIICSLCCRTQLWVNESSRWKAPPPARRFRFVLPTRKCTQLYTEPRNFSKAFRHVVSNIHVLPRFSVILLQPYQITSQ